MRRSVVAYVLAGVLAFAWVSGPAFASTRGDAARKGAEWLASQQQDDGGFFSSGQRVDQTAETLASMLAGGVTGRPVNRALAYMRKHAASGATRGAYTGRIVAGLVAAGENPSSFADTNFVARLDDQYDESSGAYDTENLFTNLMGANGALSAHGSLPAAAISYIASNGCGDGGFGFENHCAEGPDVDTSAWVINVLSAAGHRGDAAVTSAKNYILSVQKDDGGFGFTADKSTSADSTGLALSAIEALGERTTRAPWRQDDGGDPVKALLPLQDPSGGFRFVSSSGKPNGMSTINAIPGLAKVAYPVPRVANATSTPKPGATAAATARPSNAPRTAPPGLTSGQRPITGGATSTATQASPGASGSAAPSGSPAVSGRVFTLTAPPSAPFGAPAMSDETIPAPVLWAGLGVVVALSGAGTWLYLRRRGPT